VHYWGNGDPGSTGSLGAAITTIANRELNNGSRNVESGGYNCNWYSTALGSGTIGRCSNGWRTEAWCADFARWVWGQSGARTTSLGGGAASFYTYGSRFGTWHPGLSGVKPGDAVVFNLKVWTTTTSVNGVLKTTTHVYASHVGIVYSTTSGIVIIAGNSGPNTNRVYKYPISSASGYTRPIA